MPEKLVALIGLGERSWKLCRYEYEGAPLTAYHPTEPYSVEIDDSGDLSVDSVDEGTRGLCIPKLVLQHLIRDAIERGVIEP